jgi:hypothetical protein
MGHITGVSVNMPIDPAVEGVRARSDKRLCLKGGK